MVKVKNLNKQNVYTRCFRILILILMVSLMPITVYSQKVQRMFSFDKNRKALEALRDQFEGKVKPAGSKLELATLLALKYYPELKHNTIKIKFKQNVRHPITASYSFWNLFKVRKRHTYILLIKPGSFVERIDLNGQVGIIGHELAHFSYYRNRPSIGMVSWGFKYITSKRFRRRFERNADKLTIQKGLGWQLMEVAYYTSRQEIRERMRSIDIYQLTD